MNTNTHLWAGLGHGVTAGAFWGSVFLAPMLLADFSALQVTVGRYLVYGLLAFGLLWPRWKHLPAINREVWWALCVLSLWGNLIYYLFLSYAVQWVGGAVASLVVGFLPVVLMLMGVKEHRSPSLRQMLLPLLFSCLGMGFVAWQALQNNAVWGPSLSPLQRLYGFLCALGALICWAVYAQLNRQYLQRFSAFSSYDWSLLMGTVTGGLALLLGCFVWRSAPAEYALMDGVRFWTVVGGVALGASILGNRSWNQASRLLPLGLAGSVMVFETLFALLYSYGWEQRWPSALELWAVVCLLVGTGLSFWAHQHQNTRVFVPE